MARPRIQLTPEQEHEIRRRAQRGEGAASIAKALGGGISQATVGRRLVEVRGAKGLRQKGVGRAKPQARVTVPAAAGAGVGGKPAPESTHTPAALPDPPADDAVDENVPDPSNVEVAERWLQRLDRQSRVAETNGDMATFTTCARLMATFLEAKRKNAPIAPPDPNENPDMIAAKERARKELHRLIDHRLMSRYRP